jgi:excisionase family DNA binding protein
LADFGQASLSGCYTGVTRGHDASGDGGGHGSDAAAERSPFASDAQFLTVADLAHRMGVSTATIYKLVHAGELPHVRVGGMIRLSLDVMARWPRH